MIIQALNDYYNILSNDSNIEISKEGYSIAKVKFCVILSENGEMLDLVRLSDDDKSWKDMMVPVQKKRQGQKPPSYFLCDNFKYVFGWDFDPKKNSSSPSNYAAFKELHENILIKVENTNGKALLAFLDKWKPELSLDNEIIKTKLDDLAKEKSANIVFRLDSESGYIHEDEEILATWEAYLENNKSKNMGQCLVTGRVEAIEPTHPNIKGVRDANSAGATLVGVNAKAFESYSKKQAFNSPVGKSAVFAYTTVLNYMLNSKRHRIQIGDATTVFWAEDTSGECEDLLQELFNPSENEKGEQSGFDAKATGFVKDALTRLKEGKPIKEKENINFFILGLSPNNARLAVRFWHRDSFGRLVEKVWEHYRDMEIISGDERMRLVPLYRLISEVIPKKSQDKKAPPILSGALMKSIFTGGRYPAGLFYAITNRIRADGEVNHIRAGIIKAYLKRNARIQSDLEKEEMLTMSLNEESTNVAYRLGRLFAVLEKSQREASDVKLNSTIKDRYFATASTSPRAVFSVLMKLAQHHIAKNEYGYAIENRIQEIVKDLDSFPAHLNSEGQGLFILGYYHQREAFYRKNEIIKEGE
ncbi:CRISPR-associated protein Csd1 [Desulfitispora alkaliphila]|uniref:type I-C CRISPR-associated protein Cas8c/Csd1 n=1 Tax=Desulfitispora alkaliphila TaxID=622674 RepID=UPI003D1A9A26